MTTEPVNATLTNEIELKQSNMVRVLAKPGEDILSSLTPAKCHLWHMITGVQGEVGELTDALKKHIIYGKELDRENVIEELGDVEFYLEGIRQGLEISRTETLTANQAKLAERYKGAYSDQAAIEREDKKG